MSNKYQIQKAYDKLRRAKDKDILSLVGQTDWKIVNDVIMNRAMFVAPSGEIIAAKSSKGTHDRFPEDLILYVSGLPENEEPTDPFYFEQVTYDLLRDLTRLKGWIRLNGGSNAVEERCYAVLTDWNEGRPTNTQLYVLEDFINMAYDNNREYVIIFFGEGGIDSKTFYFNQYMPEDIMRIVKRYYTSGRIYEGLKKKRLKEVYPNKGESKKDFISRFMSVTKKEYPDIKQRYAVANSYWDRRDKVNEAYGYHYGDLDVAKKADRREIMGNRGTGHFGTGFYMVGTFEPENAGNYGQRACWEIDLDKYNMFKPRSNREAYKLHDALKVLNRGKPTEFPAYKFFEENILNPLYEKYLSVDFDDIEDFFGVSWSDAFDMYITGEYKTKPNKDGIYIIPEENYQMYEEEIRDSLGNIGILKYLSYDAIDAYHPGKIEEDIKRELEGQEQDQRDLRRAIRDLEDIFYGKNVEEAVEYALQSDYQEDSRSTLFMKALGYEGIDVTHLNKDDQGLKGPDNFGYGSVVYDLKPGTYRKIKERDPQ